MTNIYCLQHGNPGIHCAHVCVKAKPKFSGARFEKCRYTRYAGWDETHDTFRIHDTVLIFDLWVTDGVKMRFSSCSEPMTTWVRCVIWVCDSSACMGHGFPGAVRTHTHTHTHTHTVTRDHPYQDMSPYWARRFSTVPIGFNIGTL